MSLAEEKVVTDSKITTYMKNNPNNRKIQWDVLVFFVAIHVISLFAFFTFSWQALALCLVMHFITGCLGITLGYHRLFTHGSFKAPRFVRYFLAFCGNLACQSGPVKWVTAHRLHHLYSDKEDDPHSPKMGGFFWAHMGWCIMDNKKLDDIEVMKKVAPDLANDKGMMFLDNTHMLWTVLLAGLFYMWGGWSFVVWGIALRLVLVYHCTWLVNSAAHIWGYRTYKANDDSTNNWWVALLSYGEGWHNNHHAFQYSARHGLKWWEFDVTWLTIQFMKMFGMAESIKIPPQRLLNEKKVA